MSAPESPSALLHRAASLLGKRAQAAGGGTWNYRDSWVWDGLFEIADVHGGPDMDAIGEYIASMGPAAGLAVADWLAERASDAEDAYQVERRVAVRPVRQPGRDRGGC